MAHWQTPVPSWLGRWQRCDAFDARSTFCKQGRACISSPSTWMPQTPHVVCTWWRGRATERQKRCAIVSCNNQNKSPGTGMCSWQYRIQFLGDQQWVSCLLTPNLIYTRKFAVASGLPFDAWCRKCLAAQRSGPDPGPIYHILTLLFNYFFCNFFKFFYVFSPTNICMCPGIVIYWLPSIFFLFFSFSFFFVLFSFLRGSVWTPLWGPVPKTWLSIQMPQSGPDEMMEDKEWISYGS